MIDENQIFELPLEVDPIQVKAVLEAAEKPPLLLDCREPFEREICAIEPSLFIPMGQTPERLNELESYREHSIVVYCHAGVRSMQVAYWLRMHGFSKAQSMSMGIEGWSIHVDPDVPRY